MDARKTFSALTFALLLLPSLLHAETYANPAKFDGSKVDALIATVGGSVSLPTLPYHEVINQPTVAPEQIVKNISRGAENLKSVAVKTMSGVTQSAASALSVLKSIVSLAGNNSLGQIAPKPAISNQPAAKVAPAKSVIAPSLLPAITQPVKIDSLVQAKFDALQNAISALRETISKQSEKNVSNASSAISDGTNNLTSITGNFSSTVNIVGALTLGTATTTGANGIDISSGCFSIGGVCVGASSGGSSQTITAAYPLILNGTNSLSISFSTTTINSWSSLNSFNNASSTVLSVLQGAFFGSTATSSFNGAGDLFVVGSTTLQRFTATQGTTTSATSTNLYTTDFLSIGSTTLQKLFAQSATSTNEYTTNLLVLGSTTLQKLFAQSATSTNLYYTNLLANGSSTLLNFTAINSTSTQATTTNLFATTGNFGAASTDIVNFTAGNFNYLNRSTTTLRLLENAWVIATNTAAAAYPLMSFNNSAGTSTIQFFGATTTGLTSGVGFGIPSGQYVLIGDGKTPSGLNILKGGLCVDNDGWCTASTTGRISSVSSFLGGSDLAEMYSATEPMEPGDVVSVVSGIGVSKAVLGERDKMMGVVSTNPGVVLGTGPDTEGRPGDTPIALAGRIPVKVTTEHGNISAGDYIALSSTPGVGAKALKAGVVIGQALEDYSGAGVGKILVFVKNSYYSGISAENLPGLSSEGALPDSRAILAALVSGSLSTTGYTSEITTDRILAGLEIITPKLTAGLIYADRIDSPTIDTLAARVTALENNATQIAQVPNTTLENTLEWIGNKVTATLGTFTRLETGTIKVSNGIEMTDTATGEVYCLRVTNGDIAKTLGTCDTTTTSTSTSPSGDTPTTATSSDSSTSPTVDATTTTDTVSQDTTDTTDAGASSDSSTDIASDPTQAP